MAIDIAGLNPACATPFTEEGNIDEPALRQHIEDLCVVDGVKGLVCNAHAGEGSLLSLDERIRIVEIFSETTTEANPIVSTLPEASTQAAIKEAKEMEAAGADALLIAPPEYNSPSSAVGYFQSIGEQVDVPLLVFQYPSHLGGRYDNETLSNLVQLDSVVGLKDATWDMQQFEDDVRLVNEVAPDVTVLTGNDEYLLYCFALGGVDGGLLGLGAALPNEITEMLVAIKNNDLQTANEIYDQINPVVETIYRPQVGPRAHVLTKELLELQGALPSARPRKPLSPSSKEVAKELEESAEASDVL